ncbi:TetR/AcrR family transcriptional regulator C-terminal domain-containing protein [Reyranella sp.]|uniref:TetR/AcrR family transcriptional regulator C-terminal domain-containing protein n=1 Tax=Reyranella sp. TaxID=1929291 RepID=UPI003D0F9FA4
MAAPRKFTEAQLHEAALAIVDREGLPALTMRRLAEALGTGAMTLYNYVEGRDGLEALLVGAVMAEMVPPAMTGDDWSADVCAIATAMWHAVRRHPNVIPLILNRRADDVATLQAVEGLLEALAQSGRTGFELLAAFRLVSSFVTGFALSEVTGLLARTPGGTAPELQARLAALTQGRLARLAEIAAVGVPGNPEREFRAGLDIVIAGLKASNGSERRATKARPRG